MSIPQRVPIQGMYQSLYQGLNEDHLIILQEMYKLQKRTIEHLTKIEAALRELGYKIDDEPLIALDERTMGFLNASSQEH